MYMLDTNTVSDIVRKEPGVLKRLKSISPNSICISGITAAEIIYGLEKRQSIKLNQVIHPFLEAITIYDWHYSVAQCYGKLRAKMEKQGFVMGSLDLMIAAHALAENCTLVTSDKAFNMVPDLVIQNWRENT
ncbi:type II toxin-antitoxin system VapC family toxin [Rodentibacter trehalosifermentans]|uniref:type II toxin-antitoxin system VapC family toxin n=1 Tax=Rodentibacter trehalosifermentans TaxID=1908263 RepID=UPI000985F349|nr:type II toxin-antitoxin system VapC family toxin [Rodentibacter trehalosifermentans]OOF52323.1 VapC toxin family PIN domain ribonuclease [Rodentibacter trehalosifermentans]